MFNNKETEILLDVNPMYVDTFTIQMDENVSKYVKSEFSENP